MISKSILGSSLAAAAIAVTLSAKAFAEPTDPVVIGWWSYFDNTKINTTTSPQHQVTMFGDPDTYYYEPSGGKGLQEDPNVLPKPTAWQNMISYILGKSNNASLASQFSISTSSDLNQYTQAYFGWAFVLLYVPKDKYCDSYRIHIGSVDDGVQAMVNATVVGYANLGDQNKYIDMVEYQSNPPKLVLRPGINEVVLIHEDQAAVERYVKNVWIEHEGMQIPLAPKNIAWGQAIDSATMKPIYEAQIGINGNGVNDTFQTGPFGFYFFDGLADGSYALTADGAGYKQAVGNVAVAMGQGATEVVRTDLTLDPGCNCPDGKSCGPSGGCLDPCKQKGEFGETCDPPAVCVDHLCVTNPCDTLTCPMGFQCQVAQQGMPPSPVGVCVEIACSNVCCGAGQVCSGGLCVMDSCGMSCGDGKTCAGGVCVDSCTIVKCVGSLACVNGVCVDPCVADPSSCGNDGGLSGSGGGGGSTFVGAGGNVTGTSTGSGGSGGSGGSAGAPGPGTKSGCGCRVAGESDGDAGLAAIGLGIAAAAMMRRRRSR